MTDVEHNPTYMVPKPLIMVVNGTIEDARAAKRTIQEGFADSIQRYAQECVDNAIEYERNLFKAEMDMALERAQRPIEPYKFGEGRDPSADDAAAGRTVTGFRAISLAELLPSDALLDLFRDAIRPDVEQLRVEGVEWPPGEPGGEPLFYGIPITQYGPHEVEAMPPRIQDLYREVMAELEEIRKAKEHDCCCPRLGDQPSDLGRVYHCQAHGQMQVMEGGIARPVVGGSL